MIKSIGFNLTILLLLCGYITSAQNPLDQTLTNLQKTGCRKPV